MNPEIPYLLAGGFTIAGGAIRENQCPRNTVRAAIATIILVLFASATNDTKIAPLVRAIGLLFLLAAVMATVRSVEDSKKRVKQGIGDRNG